MVVGGGGVHKIWQNTHQYIFIEVFLNVQMYSLFIIGQSMNTLYSALAHPSLQLLILFVFLDVDCNYLVKVDHKLCFASTLLYFLLDWEGAGN